VMGGGHVLAWRFLPRPHGSFSPLSGHLPQTFRGRVQWYHLFKLLNNPPLGHFLRIVVDREGKRSSCRRVRFVLPRPAP